MKSEKANTFFLAMIVLAIFTGSCTTIHPNYVTKDENSFLKYLDDMVDIISYDQALMHFGEPASVFEGDNIFIVTWGTESLGGAVFPLGEGMIAFQLRDGWKLQLSFNKTTRKLVTWKYDYW